MDGFAPLPVGAVSKSKPGFSATRARKRRKTVREWDEGGETTGGDGEGEVDQRATTIGKKRSQFRKWLLRRRRTGRQQAASLAEKGITIARRIAASCSR